MPIITPGELKVAAESGQSVGLGGTLPPCFEMLRTNLQNLLPPFSFCLFAECDCRFRW